MGSSSWFVCVNCCKAVQLPADTPVPGRCQCSPSSFSLHPLRGIDSLRLDAARYQWIREGNLYQGPRAVWFSFTEKAWVPCTGQDLDEKCDVAILERQWLAERLAKPPS